MRLILFAAAVALLTSPASAQKPADANPTVDIYSLFGLERPDPERVRQAVEAAAAHPLGSMENPVRVGGPPGERAYIARLRCADGSAPRVGQRANAGIGAFGTIVDVYPLDCGAAAPGQLSLVMDMYHEEHREDRAPPGGPGSPAKVLDAPSRLPRPTAKRRAGFCRPDVVASSVTMGSPSFPPLS